MFADRLKELRNRKGMTQTQLADIINVTPSTIANYEAGLRTPKDNQTWVALAKALNTSLDYLIGLNDTPTSSVINNDSNTHIVYNKKDIRTQRHRNKLADKIRNSSYTDKQLSAIDALLATYDDVIDKIKENSYEKPQILAADTATDKPIIIHTDEDEI